MPLPRWIKKLYYPLLMIFLPKTKLSSPKNIFMTTSIYEIPLVDIDGKKVFQPFATAQGTGNAPATLNIPIPPKMDSVIDITPKSVVFDHTVTEIIPPSDHEIPIIPWVVSPRFPLEPLETTPPPPPPAPPYYSYGYGLEVLSPEQQRQVRSR